jgi:hypothetical protein
MPGRILNLVSAAGVAFMAYAILLPKALCAQAEIPFNEEELARLEKGQVVLRHVEKKISEEEATSLLKGTVLVHHPEEVIWEVLNHPELEKDWLPHVSQSKVVSDRCISPTSRENVTDYRIKLLGVEIYYSLVREYDYEKRTIKAHMDKERPHRFFNDIQSGWNFFPYKDGVIFQYWSDSNLVITLPQFISGYLSERAVTSGIAEVANRCDVIAQEMKNKKIEQPCSHLDKTEWGDEK